MTMSTKIIPFHRPIPKPAGPDAVYPRFAREMARIGLPLRHPSAPKGDQDAGPVH